MPKYVIPVTYTMYGTYKVEAKNITEALDKVFGDMALPRNAEFLDESLQVNEEDVAENNEKLSEADREDLSEYLAERYRAIYD